MAIKYITEPLPRFVTRIKPAGAKYTRTTYTCPLCGESGIICISSILIPFGSLTQACQL